MLIQVLTLILLNPKILYHPHENQKTHNFYPIYLHNFLPSQIDKECQKIGVYSWLSFVHHSIIEYPTLNNASNASYWSLVWQRFQKNRGAKWAFRVFIGLLWVAILNPFLAGDVPIYTKIKGERNFPIVKQYLIDLGFCSKNGELPES